MEKRPHGGAHFIVDVGGGGGKGERGKKRGGTGKRGGRGGSTKRLWTQNSTTNTNLASSPSPPKKTKTLHTANESVKDSVKEDSVHSSVVVQDNDEVQEYLIDSDSDNSPEPNAKDDANDEYYVYQVDQAQEIFDKDLSSVDPTDSLVSSMEFVSPSQKVALDVPSLREKERALLAVTNHAAAFVKGTLENKLLCSTMHEAGKGKATSIRS